MANIKFDRKEIEKEIKLTPEVVEKIQMFGVPVESLDSEILEVQILPNRPDLFSLQGFVRSLKAFLGKSPGMKKYKLHAPEKNFTVKIDSSVSKIRPYTACAIVKGLSLNDSRIKVIIDIQEKLHTTIGRNRKKAAIGIYPLEKITLPIKYEARKPSDISFIPLEMGKAMNGLQILQQHPTGREYAHLLKDAEKFPIFVDSKGNILSMPPIINSHETGKITESTKDVFIECSGSSMQTLNKILNILVTTLDEMGGKIYSMDLIYDKKITTPSLVPEKEKISIEEINSILGLDLKEKDLEKLLPRMEYEYKNKTAFLPPWRADILHPVDIMEDIAIAYGYENLIPEIPSLSTVAEERPESKAKSKIRDSLVSLGLVETSSYHLIKQEEVESIPEEQRIEVENSKTDYKFLRPTLLIPSLRILAENKDNEYPQKIFEIGSVFSLDKNSQTGIRENENLIVSATPSSFTELKQILDNLFKSIGLEYSLKEREFKGIIEGRSASIVFNGEEIGYIGEIYPETLRSANVKTPVSAIEISLEKIYSSLYPK